MLVNNFKFYPNIQIFHERKETHIYQLESEDISAVETNVGNPEADQNHGMMGTSAHLSK